MIGVQYIHAQRYNETYYYAQIIYAKKNLKINNFCLILECQLKEDKNNIVVFHCICRPQHIA
jgi:hypothetical protein